MLQPQTIQFLKNLKKNNSKEWFDANKKSYEIAKQNFYEKWYRANKTYEGAEVAWNEGDGSKSIFDAPEMKNYNVLQKPIASSAPPGPVTGGRSATPRGSATMSEVPAFRTVQEAEAANLPRGTRITVGGRPAEVN